MAKYPTTERVSSGQLKVDDLLLVRNRQSDRILLPGTTWVQGEGFVADPANNGEIEVPAGLHRVLTVTSTLERSNYSRRARRVYQVVLQFSDDSTRRVIERDQTTRVNRVVRS